MNWPIDTRGYSQRRACGLVGIDPSDYRYRATKSDDADLGQRLRELASERRRFGYRRQHILLKRQGFEANGKKVYRIYLSERLTVRKRGGRKRAHRLLRDKRPITASFRAPRRNALPRNRSLDLVSDALIDGRRFRVLYVIDDFRRLGSIRSSVVPNVSTARHR